MLEGYEETIRTKLGESEAAYREEYAKYTKYNMASDELWQERQEEYRKVTDELSDREVELSDREVAVADREAALASECTGARGKSQVAQDTVSGRRRSLLSTDENTQRVAQNELRGARQVGGPGRGAEARAE